jgi:bacterioferritin-associated ferredoxin
MATERIVCRCQGVTCEEVVKSIRALNLQTVKEVRDATGAGDGCTCCHKVLRKYLEQQAVTMTAAVVEQVN